MTLRTLAPILALALASTPRPAAAESHKLLVLQSEGRADAATRAKVDAAVVKLATASEPQASAGELNFSDAATAVGCKPEAAACKDEILGMLAVDEIVITTVTPRPGGLEVTVRRIAKGGATRDATMLLASGTPADKLDGIAPLFGATPPAPEPIEPVATQPPPRPSVIVTEPPPSHASSNHRLEIAGMAGGGALVVLGLVLWGAASGVQSDIDKAPTRSRQDLVDLKDLESRGDGYAGLGNVFAISGLVVGGIATYFYIRDRRASSSTMTARLVPAVLDHGAGLVLTIGGSP
jgi:hypothetical protein